MGSTTGRTVLIAALLALVSARATAADGPVTLEPGSEPSAPEGESPAPVTPEGRAKYEQGLRSFARKDYGAAVAAFDEGYALEPHRAFLFAKGQAQRLAGDCRSAMATYEAFLATAPPPLQVEATRLARDRCSRPPAPPPASPALTPRPAPAPPAQPTPAWRRPLALAFWGGGVLALGASTWFLFAARTARGDASAADNRIAFEEHWNRGNEYLRGAEITLAASALFVAGGAAYVHFASKTRTEPPNLSAWLAPTGGWGVHWRGHF